MIAAAAVAFVIWIASGRRSSPWHDGWFIFWVVLLVTVAVLAVAAAMPDFAEWLGGGAPAAQFRRLARSQSPATGRWPVRQPMSQVSRTWRWRWPRTARTAVPTHVVDPYPGRGDFATVSAAI